MKKLVVTGLVVTVGAYGISQFALKKIPIVLRSDYSEKTGNPTSSKTWIAFGKYVIKKLPYAQFCEITGCTYELHANYEQLITETMSEHLSRDH